jgi:hypothetical protein
METLLNKYKVDIWINGHEHDYGKKKEEEEEEGKDHFVYLVY